MNKLPSVKTVFRFLLIKIIVTGSDFAQTDSSYIQTEEVLEDILQEPIGEIDNSDLYESVEQLLQNPLNLNTATVSELQVIPGMDIYSANLIVNHRNRYRKFFSVNELYAVQDLDRSRIKNVQPFLFVKTAKDEVIGEKESSDFENIIRESDINFRSRIINALQPNKGFIENRFNGSKPKIYNRILIRYNKQYQVGYLAEKDAGEQKLNEFSTFHFAIYDLGVIHKAVAMDYLLEFGQGLTLWSPFAFSKGPDAVYPVKRTDHMIKPFTSSTENNFFRGGAAAIKIDNLIFSAFYSNNYFDANIDTITGNILSTPIDGLHRTESELRIRKSAKEKMWGGRIDFVSEKLLSLGILHYQSKYSNAFEPSSIFDIAGSKFEYTALAYRLNLNDFNFAGEFSYNGISVASINILQIALRKNFTFTASVRSYPRNFFSPHGYAFGERSGATSNEFGIYAGFRWRTDIGLINFYYDQFKFPYATFFNPQPAGGDEFLIDYLSKPLKRMETRVRYKYEKKDVPELLDNTRQLVKRLRQAVRLELIYSISNKIRVKGRFEYNSFKVNSINRNENGYLIFQDLRFAPDNSLNIYGRVIFFSTDSFSSAIYEYENDLTGVLTNIPLFGEGIRWYVLLRYKLVKFMTISLKFSETYKPREESIGSGFNEIPLNHSSILGLQFDMKI